MTPLQRLGDPLPATRLVVDRMHQEGSRRLGQFGQDADKLAVKIAGPVLLMMCRCATSVTTAPSAQASRTVTLPL